MEKKLAEISDKNKQVAHIQSYVCKLEERIKKFEENEHLYKIRLAARPEQKSEISMQHTPQQVNTVPSHNYNSGDNSMFAHLSQRISCLELSHLQQRLQRLEDLVDKKYPDTSTDAIQPNSERRQARTQYQKPTLVNCKNESHVGCEIKQ
jgi:hypothetical protein